MASLGIGTSGLPDGGGASCARCLESCGMLPSWPLPAGMLMLATLPSTPSPNPCPRLLDADGGDAQEPSCPATNAECGGEDVAEVICCARMAPRVVGLGVNALRALRGDVGMIARSSAETPTKTSRERGGTMPAGIPQPHL